MRRLKVCNRFLVWDDGEPFFYLGDTAWELFHALNREETERYFAERKRQGFTVVQAVVLAELDGLTKPNAYGRVPLRMTEGLPDPTLPDTEGEYSYWDHVDFVVETKCLLVFISRGLTALKTQPVTIPVHTPKTIRAGA